MTWHNFCRQNPKVYFKNLITEFSFLAHHTHSLNLLLYGSKTKGMKKKKSAAILYLPYPDWQCLLTQLWAINIICLKNWVKITPVFPLLDCWRTMALPVMSGDRVTPEGQVPSPWGDAGGSSNRPSLKLWLISWLLCHFGPSPDRKSVV